MVAERRVSGLDVPREHRRREGAELGLACDEDLRLLGRHRARCELLLIALVLGVRRLGTEPGLRLRGPRDPLDRLRGRLASGLWTEPLRGCVPQHSVATRILRLYIRGVTDRRQQLLDAVLDAPHDEAPRIAFAEWLDAQGDPQGEFIRLQLAAWHARRNRDVAKCVDLEKRAEALLAAHRRQWENSVSSLARNPTFIRGFVEDVTLSAREALEHLDAVYRLAPIRHLSIEDAHGQLDRLLQLPDLARLRSLNLWDSGLTDRDADLLAHSPHLTGLKILNLGFNAIGMPGLEALCASRTLANLDYLNLAGNPVPKPDESIAIDGLSGRIVREGIHLSELGRELEQRYGHIRWLHGPSLLSFYPPSADDY